jgi:hypothetical protein
MVIREKLAVGQPATGIGGIFYIILLIGILFNKAIKKVSMLKDKAWGLMKRIPTAGFIICVALLLYMNLTGFRIIIPLTGGGSADLQISNLWVTRPVALSMFGAILILFNKRAKQRKDVK